MLEGAGFDGMRFEDVSEPVLYGHDLDAALAFVRGFQGTSAALASLSDREAARTVERLRDDARGALRRRARRGPGFAFLVDHGPATRLRHSRPTTPGWVRSVDTCRPPGSVRRVPAYPALCLPHRFEGLA